MNTDQAVAHFGSKKKLADALGISPGAVTLWKNVIPHLRQYQIQTVSGGALTVDGAMTVTADESCASEDLKSPKPNGSVCLYSESRVAQ
ncbi:MULTISPECIES: Cro/CI family transcriptional regulator [unclassified Pseudomonas]|uniref:Cro/CI family transcriptional regulator n=1 Tax=unclassified Pseudomonas TaxID=196821 RepID=UPI000C8839F9|nr:MULTISPECIES: Cro/CI family transcriptional regulator [unclassified Pseudomonas]PNA93087.1 Cro/Cl family transcriptional regulator [Pseudomonas sp. GW460-5]PNB55623.1 Cro/Cl family transcriptional regulator [Pseudomonas sp. FW305-130]PYG97595.1 Cro/Cl family transcriptional regulator [Arthrobacter stackebrandtii]